MSFLLSCHSLRRQVGSRVLLSVDRLELEPGGIYLLSGANGAGKTSLLRVLGGLDSASCASFEFEGAQHSISPYPRMLHRRIAFVHHHPVVFSTSVTANIAYGLRATGVNRREIGRRTAAAIEWAGLGPLVETPPEALSAGEKQRLALARVHAMNPLLYLLDEPTANLDESGRDLIMGLIGAISQEGRTLLIACHDRELFSLSGVTRLHMSGGRLENQA